MPRIAFVAFLSYALGCLVAGYYVVRAFDGGDVRLAGSGNAGVRNVARTHGTTPAVVTLFVDMGKASAAVFVAGAVLQAEWAGVFALVLVVAGHVWPLQLGFRGGKGAAAAAGGFVAAEPVAALIAIGIGLAALLLTRRFTAGGLVAIAVAPLGMIALHRSWTSIVLAALGSAIVLCAHHPRADARRAAMAASGR